MLTEVRMPKLGMSMRKGTVKRWLADEGGAVSQGEPLLEVMTEKINAVVESPASGVLGRIVAGPGAELPVGALLALIGEASDAFPDGGAMATAAEPSSPPTLPHSLGEVAAPPGVPAKSEISWGGVAGGGRRSRQPRRPRSRPRRPPAG